MRQIVLLISCTLICTLLPHVLGGKSIAEAQEDNTHKDKDKEKKHDSDHSDKKKKEEDIEKINKLLQKWADLYNGEKFEKLGDLYTEDCSVLSSGFPITKGKEDVIGGLMYLSWSGVNKIENQQQEVQHLSDDVIVSQGEWTMVRAATNERRTFKDVLIWKRVDDDWLIFKDCWNYNN